jgi:hypothetical protein
MPGIRNLQSPLQPPDLSFPLEQASNNVGAVESQIGGVGDQPPLRLCRQINCDLRAHAVLIESKRLYYTEANRAGEGVAIKLRDLSPPD